MKKNIKTGVCLISMVIFSLFMGCSQPNNHEKNSVGISDTDSLASIPTQTHEEEVVNPVEIVDMLDLRIYYPNYSKIDLICDTMPSKDDQSVIMFAEAAFTGELLEEFHHKNIASSHVSNGVYHSGYLKNLPKGN